MPNKSKQHSPRNVLVTGGCGFIGSNFVNFALKRWTRANIVNLDKLAPGASAERILEQWRNSNRYKLVHVDLREASVLRRILKEYKIDTIIHFAALTHVDESYADPAGYMQENLGAMTVLLETIREYGRLERLIHISTDEVYGDCIDAEVPKDENSLLDPTNPYAASKAACELLLRSYKHSYSIPYIMVRMNNVYGPRQFHTKLVPKFVRLAIEGKPFTLAGDGTPKRSWMFVEDCVEAIQRVTEQGMVGQVYNIGTEFELSNIELAKRIHETVNRLVGRETTEPQFESVQDRPHNDLRYWIDFGKIRRELGWQCQVSFEEGLAKTVAYYLGEWSAEMARNGERWREKNGETVHLVEETTDNGRNVKVVA